MERVKFEMVDGIWWVLVEGVGLVSACFRRRLRAGAELRKASHTCCAFRGR